MNPYAVKSRYKNRKPLDRWKNKLKLRWHSQNILWNYLSECQKCVYTIKSNTIWGKDTPPKQLLQDCAKQFGELQPRHGLDDKFSILEILYKGAYFEICMPFLFLDGGNCTLSKLVIYGI